jgi:putative peptidoglycan lipid II flippase
MTSIVAAVAMVSSLLLDIAIAARFGAGAMTDAFFVAARIPVGITVLALAVSTQALVPTFSTWQVAKDRIEANRLMSLVLAAALALGFALWAVGTIVAGPLVRLTAPGLSSAQVVLAASMVRVMFLIVPLVATAEVLRSFLNARYSFVAPAAMNVAMSGTSAVIVVTLGGDDIRVVAWAYVAGAAVQLVFMTAVALHRGFGFVFSARMGDPDLVATARLGGRPLLSAGLNLGNRLGEQLLVSFLPAGSITVLNYGYRLISAVGGGVFFRSVIVALLPRLTTAVARGEDERVAATTRTGLRLMLAISLPLTAVMVALGQPAVLVAFGRGSFSDADASLLGLLLVIYSASLVGSAVQRVLLAPFFARLDTKVHLANTFLGVVVNLVLASILVAALGGFDGSVDGAGNGRAVLGVAIAFSVTQYVLVAHAWTRLRTRTGLSLAGVGPFFVRILVASVVAGAIMSAAANALGLGPGLDRSQLVVRTATVGTGGLIVLAATLWVLAGSEVRRSWRSLREPSPRGPNE